MRVSKVSCITFFLKKGKVWELGFGNHLGIKENHAGKLPNCLLLERIKKYPAQSSVFRSFLHSGGILSLFPDWEARVGTSLPFLKPPEGISQVEPYSLPPPNPDKQKTE